MCRSLLTVDGVRERGGEGVTAAFSPAEGTGTGAGTGRIWRPAARGAGDQPPATRTYSQIIAGLRDLPGPAVLAGAATCTWPQLLGRTSSAVRWLADLGAAPGKPVAALVTTSPDVIALTLAGAAAGKPMAPLGPRLTERELVPCVRGIEADVLIAEPEYAELGERVARAAGARLAILPEFAVSPDIDVPTPGMTDIAIILHTSGTTGLPKAVPMSQRMLAQRVIVNSALLQLDPASVYASASPFHHIAGWGNVAVALGAGATIVPVPKFTVEGWQDLGPLGITHALLVPTMIDMLLARNSLRLGPLRVLQYGAAPIHPDTLRRAMTELPDVTFVDIYGQTEGSPVSCLTFADHLRAAAGDSYLLASVGRAVPGVELRIAEPGDDGVGELLARGPHLFRYADDGWQHTGDLGWLDAEGYLYLVGRKGDMIIRGGENVYPLEVENVLTEHPAVADAVIVGVPDQRLGEMVKAYIVPTDAASPPAFGALRAFTRERLAGFKVPVLWEFIDVLPRNANGKVIRAPLIERAATASSQEEPQEDMSA
jgi:acyl-CoA synthetase (AMP-forming)/AMP-acid ligase II